MQSRNIFLKNRKRWPYISFFYFFALFVTFAGCSKLVEVPPPVNNLTSETVFSSDPTAAAAVTAIYDQMSGGTNFVGEVPGGVLAFTSVGGLSSDELQVIPNAANIILEQAYVNSLNSNPNPLPYWDELYNLIYLANNSLEGLSSSTAVTASLKQQLTGEAEFIRAYCHFYLTNMYGDVPWVTSTSYQANAVISRMPQAQVYANIISDLTDAKNLLSANFLSPLGAEVADRVRPNLGAANALLARVYLYTQNWDSAVIAATSVINNTGTYSLDTLNGVFLINSSETIWALQSISPGFNTNDAYTYILTDGPNPYYNPFYLSQNILNSFEPGDNRYNDWVGVDSSTGTKYYYAYKYKAGAYGLPFTENLVMFRLAEQYAT